MWAQRTRDNYRLFLKNKKCLLDKLRIRRLDEIGFDWKLTSRFSNRGKGKLPDDEAWEAQLAKLQHVYDTYGNVNEINNIRAAYPGDERLLAWVKHQRRHYCNKQLGKWHSLTPARQEKLDALEFNYQPRKHWAPAGSVKKQKEAAALDNFSI